MSAQGPEQTPRRGRAPTAFGGSAIPSIAGLNDADVTAEINVTPMVDVMLVLLIIFMVVTPVLTQYEATPPTAVTARPEPDDDVITLGIDVAGDFFVENEAVTDDQLTARLLEHYRGRPGDRLLYALGRQLLAKPAALIATLLLALLAAGTQVPANGELSPRSVSF